MVNGQPIAIPLPNEDERLEFIRSVLGTTPLPAGSDVADATLAKLSAGLKRVQLQSLISEAVQNRQPLTLGFMTQRKKELIEAESGGLLEFVQSRFDLSFVAGHEQAKKKLQDAASAIRSGRTDVLPMGYVICGPVGTGKTFLVTCFAGVVRGGRIVSSSGIISAGLAVRVGIIVAISHEDALPEAREAIDATGKYILPGVIDPHVHSSSTRGGRPSCPPRSGVCTRRRARSRSVPTRTS